jgi:hypothetical protein
MVFPKQLVKSFIFLVFSSFMLVACDEETEPTPRTAEGDAVVVFFTYKQFQGERIKIIHETESSSLTKYLDCSYSAGQEPDCDITETATLCGTNKYKAVVYRLQNIKAGHQFKYSTTLGTVVENKVLTLEPGGCYVTAVFE